MMTYQISSDKVFRTLHHTPVSLYYRITFCSIVYGVLVFEAIYTSVEFVVLV